MFEPPVRVENRTQLISLLSEAAELEHGIGCCYLFAAFSLKTAPDEGLSAAQLATVGRWKRAILDIAVQEMLHLALVNNLLIAIGGAAHLRRPNLPASPTMYPPSFRLALRPFDVQTVESFVYLERPEGSADQSGGDPEPGTGLGRSMRPADIFPGRPEYRTVGHLYRGIEDGLRYLAEKYGQDGLFIVPGEAQAAVYPRLDGLATATDLASAVLAVRRIVDQGEGARRESADSHYAKFSAISAEYETARREAADFTPGRPVMVNPHAHAPADVADPGQVNLLDDPVSIACCRVFDAAYEVLAQMLGRLFAPTSGSDAELHLLRETSAVLMTRVMTPLGDLITRLPAGPSHPGLTAGPSFTFSRALHAPPHKAAWRLWRERLSELSAYCALLEAFGGAPPGLSRISQTLARSVSRIDALLTG